MSLVSPPARLSVSLGGQDLRCRMSAENLSIVLGNFAENSAQHGARQLAISAENRDEDVIISLQDDGDGILPGNRDRIFAPFFTTRRDSGGTGIGLSIVAALVSAHGGRANVVESNRGAAFEVRLPAA